MHSYVGRFVACQVLKHIANQAKVQAAHMRLGTRTGSRRSGKAWRKILSDVDDTLTSSGKSCCSWCLIHGRM